MSNTKHSTNRDASQLLNNWLCGQVSNATSLEALENIAKHHDAYQDDVATMRIIGRVWGDYCRAKSRGAATSASSSCCC